MLLQCRYLLNTSDYNSFGDDNYDGAWDRQFRERVRLANRKRAQEAWIDFFNSEQHEEKKCVEEDLEKQRRFKNFFDKVAYDFPDHWRVGTPADSDWYAFANKLQLALICQDSSAENNRQEFNRVYEDAYRLVWKLRFKTKDNEYFGLNAISAWKAGYDYIKDQPDDILRKVIDEEVKPKGIIQRIAKFFIRKSTSSHKYVM